MAPARNNEYVKVAFKLWLGNLVFAALIVVSILLGVMGFRVFGIAAEREFDLLGVVHAFFSVTMALIAAFACEVCLQHFDAMADNSKNGAFGAVIVTGILLAVIAYATAGILSGYEGAMLARLGVADQFTIIGIFVYTLVISVRLVGIIVKGLCFIFNRDH